MAIIKALVYVKFCESRTEIFNKFNCEILFFASICLSIIRIFARYIITIALYGRYGH